MTPDASPAVERCTAVRWGDPERPLHLEATDPRVLARASVVFRPWRLPDAPSGNDRDPVAAWTIARRDGDDAWEIGRDGRAVCRRATPEQAVTALEFLGVTALYEHPDVLAFHAALVASGDRAVLICGPCGAGKSTLACALWQRGWSLLGDDTAVVELDRFEARSAPRRVSLRTSSEPLLGDVLRRRIAAVDSSEPTPEGWLFHPGDIQPGTRGSARLAACVFLARLGASEWTPTPLPPAHAALALLPYANQARRADAGVLIPRLGGLTSRIPCIDLPRAPLLEMTETIAGLVNRPGT